MRPTTSDKFNYWLFGTGMPVTKLLIGANVVTFLAITASKSLAILEYLGFSSESVARQPWTLLTYPLVGVCCNPISLFLVCWWLWIAGGSLERSFGSRRFAVFFFAMSAVSALGLLAGGFVLGIATSAAGLWLPLAGLTIAFAALNPEDQILFFFLIPLKLKFLAALDVAAVLVVYGRVSLLLGLFALAGCGFSYWYVRRGRRRSYRTEPGQVIRLYHRRNPLSRLNPVKWYTNYRERRRLKDFLDRSGFGD